MGPFHGFQGPKPPTYPFFKTRGTKVCPGNFCVDALVTPQPINPLNTRAPVPVVGVE